MYRLPMYVLLKYVADTTRLVVCTYPYLHGTSWVNVEDAFKVYMEANGTYMFSSLEN